MYTFESLRETVRDELAKLALSERKPHDLFAPIDYMLQGGGKRVRPVGLLMACNLFSDDIRPALPAALAIEVFHNFTLLHDDIMDEAPTRHGRPTVHMHWNNNTAILSGDAMLIAAYQLLAGVEPDKLGKLLPIFSTVAMQVCEGQQYDMCFEQRQDVTADEYITMIELKTAVLLAGALQIGAICGGASPAQAGLLYRFGMGLGTAFQLQDDLLDTYGDPKLFGKRIGGDICCAKNTFLLVHAREKANKQTISCLNFVLGDKTLADDAKIDTVRQIYTDLQVKEATEQAIAHHFGVAQEALRELVNDGLPAERIAPLESLANHLLNRQK